MEPEDDYPSFLGHFRDCIDSDAYVPLLNGILRLVSSIISTGAFPDPIKNRKDQFLKTDLNDILVALLDKGEISTKESLALSQFLQILSLSVIIGINKGIKELIETERILFDKQQEIFQEFNDCFISFPKILEYCYQNKAIDYLSCLMSAEDPVLFQTGMDIINIFIKSKITKDEESQMLSMMFETSFIKYLDHFNQKTLRTVNANDLIKLVRYMMKLTKSKIVCEKILNFAKTCLQSEYVDKNLMGIDILVSSSIIFRLKYPINQWALDNHMIDYFFNTKFHEEIIQVLTAKKLFMGVKPTNDQNWLLWNRVIREKNQRDNYIKLLAQSLFEQKADLTFLEKIFGTECDNKIKSDLALAACKVYAPNNDKTVIFWLTKYFQYMPEQTTKCISKIMDLLNVYYYSLLTNEYLQKLMKHDVDHNVLLVLNYLCTNISENIPNEMISNVIDLLNLMPGETQLIFSIIEAAMKNSTKQFTSEETSVIWKNKNNYAYSCISSIIQNRYSDCFESEAFELFVSNLGSLQAEEFTTLSINLIYILIVAVSYEHGFIVSQSENIMEYQYVKTFDLPHLDLLFNALYNSTDKQSIYLASKFLIIIFSKNAISLPNSLDYLVQTLLPIINGEEIGKQIRALSFILAYIRNSEKGKFAADYGITRHHEKANSHFIHINVLSHNRDCGRIFIDPYSKVEDLLERISILYGVTSDAVSASFDNKILRPTTTLISNHLKNNSIINAFVEQDEDFKKVRSKSSLPSYQLFEIGMTKNLLTFLKAENPEELQKAAIKVLNLMPTDEEIIYEISQDFGSALQYKGRMQKYIFRAISLAIQRIRMTRDGQNDVTDMQKSDLQTIWMSLKRGEISSKNECAALEIFLSYIPTDENGVVDVWFMLEGINRYPGFSKIMKKIFHSSLQIHTNNVSYLFASDVDRFNEYLLHFNNNFMVFFTGLAHMISPEYCSTIFNGICKILPRINEALSPSNILEFISVIYQKDCQSSEVLSFCSSNIKNEKLVYGICVLISRIFESHPELIPFNRGILESIIPDFIKQSSTNDKHPLVNIIHFAVQNDDETKAIVAKHLKGYFDFPFDCWDYDMQRDMKSLPNHTGLTNLGCTCYMNAVLQQLYACEDYRNQIISPPPSQLIRSTPDEANAQPLEEKKWLIALREIFTKIKYSERRAVSTRSLCSTFLFNEVDPINTRQQQDAAEFYMTLVDQLNSNKIPSEDFKITTKVVLQGTDEDFTKEISETLFVISVPMKKAASLQDFLQIFAESELSDEYFADTLNKKIKIHSKTTVKHPPRILVFQLNRFAYSVKTYSRTKLNDYFRFPFDIDIQEIMDDKSSQKYTLKGVVIHSGVADMGHYFSLIKENDQWIEYNDNNVSPISIDAFEEYSYGTESNGYSENGMGSQSAYLLFYVKQDDTKTEIVSSFNTIDQNLMKEIQTDNELFNNIQTAFSLPMSNLMEVMTDQQLLLNYMLRVFIHSSDKGNSQQFIYHVLNVIKQNNSAYEALEFLTKNKEEIVNALLSAMPNSIMRYFLFFIETLIKLEDPGSSFELIYYFTEQLPFCTSSWKQVTNIGLIIADYLKNQDNFEFASSQRLIDMIVLNITKFLNSLTSPMCRNSVNLSCLIEAVTYDFEAISQSTAKAFIELYQTLLLNPACSSSFSLFVVQSTYYSIINLDDFIYKVIDFFTDDEKFDTALISLFTGCRTNEEVDNMAQSIMDALKDGEQYLAAMFKSRITDQIVVSIFENYPDLLLIFLRSKKNMVRLIGEQAFYLLFTRLSPPDFGSYADADILPQNCKVYDRIYTDLDVPLDFHANRVETKRMECFISAILKTFDSLIKNKFLSRRLPVRKYTNLVRITSWIMERSSPNPYFISRLLSFLDFQCMQKNDNYVLLQILISLAALPDKEKLENSTNAFPLFQKIFPLKSTDRELTDARTFFEFFRFVSLYLENHIDDFIAIIKSDAFLLSFKVSSTYASSNQMEEFLIFLKKMNKNHELHIFMNQSLKPVTDFIIDTFSPSSFPLIASYVSEIFEIEDRGISLNLLLHSFFSCYSSNNDVSTIAQAITDKEIKEVPSWCLDEMQECINPSNEGNITSGFPVIFRLCMISPLFYNEYVRVLCERTKKKHDFTIHFYQLTLVLNAIPNPDHCERAIKLFTTQTNSKFMMPRLLPTINQALPRIIANSNQSETTLMNCMQAVISHPINNEEDVKEVIFALVTKLESNPEVIYKAISNGLEISNDEEQFDIFVFRVATIIEQFPTLKEGILHSLNFSEDQFQEWDDECLKYIEFFI